MEIIEVILVLCNIVNNNHGQNSRVLYTFVPNKSYGQVLVKVIFLWFADKSSKSKEIEDKLNITLIIKKKWHAIQFIKRSNICK